MNVKQSAQAQRPGPAGAAAPAAPIEAHDRRLLRWLAQGRSMASIAQHLQRPEAKLAAHVSALLAQLGVADAGAALARLGLPVQDGGQDGGEDGGNGADGGETGAISTTPF